jgi:photosystem II stability/assembly factor-like uncharacterized protein
MRLAEAVRTAGPNSWRARVVGVVLASLSLSALGCGDDANDAADAGLSAQPPTHVHGLGLNPAANDLYVATHSGLFRSAKGSDDLERVGESSQDTMGFTVVGPDHFLGSGHPAPDQPGPTSLGLIESKDGGETWEEVSLAGEADFHILRFADDRIYGYDALNNLLSLSQDGGETWTVHAPPAPLIDLAVDPEDPERLVASSERGLSISTDAGGSWRPLAEEVGMLAWPAPDAIFLIDGAGRVQRTADPEASWRTIGKIGGQPAALLAIDDRRLYAALADASVLRSNDGGASWAKLGG